jgi:Tfp pilus assembly protein PilE
MGCLLVIVMGAASAAMIYFFGYHEWVLLALGALWLASIAYSAVAGHWGFGGGGNTDLQIVIAGLGVAAAIIVPNYTASNPCNQARTALKNLSSAEEVYFDEHKVYAADLKLLDLASKPDLQIKILKADDKSYTASASHNQCMREQDSVPETFRWDSAAGGLQP